MKGCLSVITFWHERSILSFAALLPNVLVREHVFQLVFHGGPEGGQHAKPQHKLAPNVLKSVSSQQTDFLQKDKSSSLLPTSKLSW